MGTGSRTTHLLILLLGVGTATAVGTALTFGAIVKIASVPVYAFRNQVNLRILKLLLLGGLPGVLVGSLVLGWLKDSRYSGTLYVLLGSIIVSISLFHLWRIFFPYRQSEHKDRPTLLWSCSFPIVAEVVFFLAGV